MASLRNQQTALLDKRIAEKAVKRWGNRCPCCERFMSTAQVKKGKSSPRDKRTIGHDYAVALGGNPRIWVYMCHQCNNEQGGDDLVTWSRRLKQAGHVAQELRVLELATFVRRMARDLSLPA